MIVNRTTRQKLKFDLELAMRQLESEKTNIDAASNNTDILAMHIKELRKELDALPND